jgi:hypothetical protein
MKILLVEPQYKTKFPPIGLMKLSAFHKDRGDDVYFVKGLGNDIKKYMWDRIYISTLFSYYWNETIDAIKYYEHNVKDPKDLYIGGPMATIMADEIYDSVKYKVVKGLLNDPGKINIKNDHLIDSIIPDYDIIDSHKDLYVTDSYYSTATRGCIRKCRFCAVPIIENKFNNYICIKDYVDKVDRLYGPKKDLILMDNNILASSRFDNIVDDIKNVGFYRGATLKGKLRFVDFNQGIDLRLLTKSKIKILSQLPVKPLRIAFDDIRFAKEYIRKMEWAAEYGIKRLSNYILYNYSDTPDELYERLKINIDLNTRLGTKIFSFPMRYIPINAKDRKYVSKHWNMRYLRSVQCILNATHGIVSGKKDFFEAAFGKNIKEFRKLMIMPERYIIYREKYKGNGAVLWENMWKHLDKNEEDIFYDIIYNNINSFTLKTRNKKVNNILSHYKDERKTKYEIPDL